MFNPAVLTISTSFCPALQTNFIMFNPSYFIMLTRRAFLSCSAVIATGCTQEGDGEDPDTGELSLDSYASNITRNAPREGTLSIADTVFVEPGEMDLDDGDIVFGLEHEGEARAYPRRILVPHRVVNDTIAGESILITYSPLAGTARGFKRGEAEFGNSGLLVNSNLVMYDSGTESLWPHILGTSIDGPRRGETLEGVRLIWTTWERWRDEHPETRVLSEEVRPSIDYDYDDPYGSYNPRTGYYENEEINYSLMRTDDRFAPKKVFVCARESLSDTQGDGTVRHNPVAFSKDMLRDERVASIESQGRKYFAFYDSDLDTAYIYRGNLNGVEYDGERYTDGRERWEADDAPDSLGVITSFDSMWFAWAAFYPGTEVRG